MPNFLSHLKQTLLPPSSRSFHQAANMTLERLAQLQQQNEQLHQRINELEANIRTEHQFAQVSALMFYWQLYAQPGETLEQAKLRFFHNLPKASGVHRLFQDNEAKLFGQFDALCREHDIQYWAIYGTLLGAYRHGDLIPWDDDIDVYIASDQLEKLQQVVDQDPRYRITVVWDWYVPCKQIRFRLADENNPGFVDLFPVYWTSDDPQTAWEKGRQMREAFIHAVREQYADTEWAELKYIPDTHALAGGLEALLRGLQQRLSDDITIVNCADDATGIVRGMENIDEVHSSGPYPIHEWLPAAHMMFRDFEIPVPPTWEQHLSRCYGDYMSLPNDMASHEHVADDYIGTAKAVKAMHDYLEDDRED